ncbi:hypothetical protein CYMTET_21381 [Cymbomonas tetramitiformis]|uniref:Pesticidal crystal protein Cry22Aa Ig-like domain-containing protein n=1 Tax=Cymbomonas tetramitiformis TaxID=36881 RepID=A0AAE0G294_9CHLO|nr:hypothetical protein CYMTET_21381 [Cymbomonas tetramitiformis]
MYYQGSTELTCFRSSALTNSSVESISINTVSGPTNLAWFFNGSSVCTESSGCLFDMCGFSPGSYLLRGTSVFVTSAGIPPSTQWHREVLYARHHPPLPPSRPAAALYHHHPHPHLYHPTPKPLSPPGTTTVELVSSAVTFSGLDVTAFDSAVFSANFTALFIFQIVSQAGVDSTNANVSTITSGSVVVISTVYFPATATSTAAAYSTALTSDPSSIFTIFGTTYGDISASILSTGFTSRVYSPPPPPCPPPLSPPPPPPTPSPPPPSPPQPSPPPPSFSLSGIDMVSTTYNTGNIATTCFTAAAPSDIQHITVDATSGPSLLSWQYDATQICSAEGCQISLCGLSLGTYTLQGVITFVSSNTPTSHIVGTLHELTSEEDYYYESYLMTSPDYDPPVITLRGDMYTEVQQTDDYVDFGVSAYDIVDGYDVHVVVSGVEAVDTCCATPPGEPFIITYNAVDRAGNAASEVVRQVAVRARCEPPSFLCENEDVCATCSTAVDENAGEGETAEMETSTVCVCLGSLSVEVEQGVVVEAYIPEEDTVAPVLILLGEGKLGVTASGVMMMTHDILLQDPWVDPGVEVSEEDTRVESFGAGTVDTSVATLPDAPYVVTYRAVDSAGNVAVEARRHIVVYNPCAAVGEDGRDEVPCGVAINGTVVCSHAGLCTTFDLLGTDGDTTEPEHEPPSIHLLGPATVEVQQFAIYAACVEGITLMTEVCDRGAEASDALDGDLTARVLACSPDGLVNRFANVGVRGCAVDTSTPGVYTVTFSVANSASLVSSVERNVTVIATCPITESLCSDGISCSKQGVCMRDLDNTGLDSNANVVLDSPPTIELLASTTFVEVRQHQVYAACAERDAGNAEVECEPGVAAYDTEDGDLSSQVLVCPPSSCIAVGCPGHEWAIKGLQGCINTSAPVGTVFEVEWVVFDSGMLAQNASVTRLISIIQPCNLGETLCDDLTCSTIDCDTRDTMLADDVDTTAPVVTMLLSSPMRVSYGDAATATVLQPCHSDAITQVDESAVEGASTEPCAARATDDRDGDVSSSLIITQDTTCAGCSNTGCPVDQAHDCFPGTYGYMYTAEDTAGNQGVARLVVTVVEVAILTAQAVLSTGTADVASAEAMAAVLLEENSTDSAAFREGMAQLLNEDSTTAGEDIRSSDVSIVAVTVWDASSKPATSSETDSSEPEDERDGFILSLAVTFDTVLAVAEGSSSVSGQQRRRQLLQDITHGADSLTGEEEDAALAMRIGDVSTLLAAAADDGRMSSSLANATKAKNSTLATDVGGLAGDVSSEQTSPEVDLTSAYQAQIKGEMQRLQGGAAKMYAAVGDATAAAATSGGAPQDWLVRMLEIWQSVQQEELANVDALLATADQLMELYRRAATNQKAVRDGLLNVEIAIQDVVKTMDLMLDTMAQASDTPDGLQQSTAKELRYTFTVSPPSAYHGRRELLSQTATAASFHEYDNLAMTTDLDEVSSLPTTTARRHLKIGRNAVIAGLMFYVTRAAEDSESPCTLRFSHLEAPCLTKTLTGHYGSDPVFFPGTSLFRADMQNDLDQYYNTSEGSAMIDPNTSSPHPFAPRHLPGHRGGQPFMLDTRLASYRAQQVYTFLEEGGLVSNDATQMIEATMLTWNSQLQAWVLTAFRWHRPRHGGWQVDYDVSTIEMTYWNFDTPRNAMWLLLHIVWVLVSLNIFWKETLQLLPSALKHSHPDIDGYLSRLLLHLSSSTKLLAIFGTVMQLVVVATFIAYHCATHFVAAMDAHYEIYYDLYANANYFLSSRVMQEDSSLAEPAMSLLGAPAWAHPEDNTGLEKYANDVATMHLIGQLYTLYFIMQGLRALIMIVRILVVTSKQKRLSVVLNTARSSMIVLANMLSFHVCFALFGVLFHVEMGARLEQYSTIMETYRILSEFAFYKKYKKVRDSQWEHGSFFLDMKDRVYVFAFTSLFFFIMSNLVFCVVCDEVLCHWIEARFSGSRTMVQDLTVFYKNRLNRKIKRKWPAMEKVIDALQKRIHGDTKAKCKQGLTRSHRITIDDIISGTMWQLNRGNTDSQQSADLDDARAINLLGRKFRRRDIFRCFCTLRRRDRERQSKKVQWEAVTDNAAGVPGEKCMKARHSTQENELKKEKYLLQWLSQSVVDDMLQSSHHDALPIINECNLPTAATRRISKQGMNRLLTRLCTYKDMLKRCNDSFEMKLEGMASVAKRSRIPTDWRARAHMIKSYPKVLSAMNSTCIASTDYCDDVPNLQSDLSAADRALQITPLWAELHLQNSKKRADRRRARASKKEKTDEENIDYRTAGSNCDPQSALLHDEDDAATEGTPCDVDPSLTSIPQVDGMQNSKEMKMEDTRKDEGTDGSAGIQGAKKSRCRKNVTTAKSSQKKPRRKGIHGLAQRHMDKLQAKKM